MKKRKEENRTKKRKKRMHFVDISMNSSIKVISRPLIISTWCNIKKKDFCEKSYDRKNVIYSIFL